MAEKPLLAMILALTVFHRVPQHALPSQPIVVSGCSFIAPIGPPIPPLFLREGPLSITFTNAAKQTALFLEFSIIVNGHANDIVDRGTFSPRVPITHQYPSLTGLSTQKLTCVPVRARFADGSQWHRSS